MKLPNGFGSVYKLPGKRRNPWAAVITVRWEIDMKTQRSKQIKKYIGYYSTRKEALEALTLYNENPYDLDAKMLTFSDVYEKWSASYFPTLAGPSSIRTITAAYKYCSPLYDMKMQDIRVVIVFFLLLELEDKLTKRKSHAATTTTRLKT